jgi:hypothetical protein
VDLNGSRSAAWLGQMAYEGLIWTCKACPGPLLPPRLSDGTINGPWPFRLPLLLPDVDVALNPFAASAFPPGYTEHEFFPRRRTGAVVRVAHEPWLQELATRFQIVWATAWGRRRQPVSPAPAAAPAPRPPRDRLPAGPFHPAVSCPPSSGSPGAAP